MSLPEDGFRVGGAVSLLTVSLRVTGEALEPPQITQLLGVQPQFAARKGEQRQSGTAVITQRVGIWIYSLLEEPSPEWDLDDAITQLLDRLPAELSIWKELKRSYDLDVYCGLFLESINQGTQLCPSTLLALAEREIVLSLDIYSPSDDDEAT